MYAVIETGGKQYRVEVGMELEVELLDGDAGASVNLERVLLVADGDTAAIGRPVVANASVAAEIVRRERGEKLISFKYRPKARRRVKKGHRQELTILRISDIVLDGKSAAAEKAEADKARRAERERLEETARRQAAADAELASKLASEKRAQAAADEKAARGSAKADKEAARKPDETAKSSAPKSTAKGSSKATSEKATTSAKPSAAKARPKADTAGTETKTPKRTRSTTKKDT
jgi:large subunit ribosomal protein L21